jgi:uncharacterized repeat protein (TIGR03803 family)
LYGTTVLGGANGLGTIFKVDAATHTLTTLVSFANATGAFPETGLVFDAQGNLYGTTSAAVHGIFKLANDMSTITVLSSSVGSGIRGDLVFDANGNLFGTTTGFLTGTAFELAARASTTTTLYTFNGLGNDPEGGLIADSNGNLVGTTMSGSSNFGTVFELSPVPEASSVVLKLWAIGALVFVARMRRQCPTHYARDF